MTIGFGLALALAAGSGAAEDDLAVVKKAVARRDVPAAASEAEPAKPAPRAARKAEPRWLRVRVREKGADEARVSVNLPIGLVEALGDEPIDLCPRRPSASKCHFTLRELLSSFETGQPIVDVEGKDGDVKVWVE
jgi:hypothetical protein